MPRNEPVSDQEQRQIILDQALDRELTCLRRQEATIPTSAWEKERQVLIANVAIETLLRLCADTLPDALRFRVFALTDSRNRLLCRGVQPERKREVHP